MSEQSFSGAGSHHSGDFLDRFVSGVLQAMDHAFDAEDLSRRDGLLQRLDPRTKLAGLLTLIAVAVISKSLAVIVGLFVAGAGLALLSRVPLSRLAKQVWLSVFAFTGMIALPAIFLVEGDVVLRLPILHWPVTMQGIRSAAFLISRAETTATYALLLILCTPWPHVLKALRICRVPVVLVVILGMTYRFIFVFLQIASQIVEARRSRMAGVLTPRERRRVTTGIAGTLFDKALQMSGDVHLAMISRGYRGEVHLLDEFHTSARDWLALSGFAAIAAAALWLQA